MSRAVGVLLLIAFVPLALFVLTGAPSASGAAYVVGLVTLAAALAGPARRRRHVALAGLALLVVPAVLRLALTRRAGDVRAIDRLVDERDVAIQGSRAVARTQLFHDPDVSLVPDAMRAAYDEMDREEGALPSPFAATYLGLERPGASDTVEFDAEGPDAVVFLHGYAGNFTLSCWLFARAAARAGMTTVCPSTSWRGDWWSATGESIVRGAMAALRARGKARVFLAGLSNGAIGASRLAPRLRAEIAGLVLVSGAAPDAPAPGVPALVVQGGRDAMTPASVSRAYALRAGARYVELDGGHFALLLDRDRAERAVTEWLAARTSCGGRVRCAT